MKNLHTHSAVRFTAIAVAALSFVVGAVGPMGRVYAAVGDLDPKFGNGGKVFTHIGFGDRVASLAFQPDGKIIAAGASASRGIFSSSDFAIVRYNVDGSLDTSFGAGGKVTTDFFDYEDYINAVALQTDGKIVAVGRARDGALAYFGLARYNKDGSLDSTFGSGGKVVTSFFGYGDDAHALAIQPDGKIVVAGTSFSASSIPGDDGPNANFGLARYNSNGSLDPTFGFGGKVTTDFGNFDIITAIAIQPDGKIVAGGDTTNKDTNTDFALARYNKDGSLDPSFGSGGKVVTDFVRQPDFVAGLALQPDGKIVVAGDVSTDTSPHSDVDGFGLARYNKDGSLDSTFGSGGKVITEGELIAAYAVAIQPNGKIIAAGLAIRNRSNGDFALARYNSNGSLDPGFGSGGIITTDFTPSDQAFAMGFQSDGKVVAGGAAYDAQVGNGFALARYDVGDINSKTYDTHVQNDTSLLQFDSVSGDYSFTDCVSGFTLSGVGRIKTHGCKIVLRDGGDDFEVWATVNMCTSSGKSSIQVFPQGVTYSVKDRDITNKIPPCR
jgi:uncharacterized delta-60 repeat protein